MHRMHRMHRMHNHLGFFLLFYIVLYYIYIFCLFYLLKNRTNSIFGAVLFFQMIFMDRYSLDRCIICIFRCFIIVYFIYRKFVYMN